MPSSSCAGRQSGHSGVPIAAGREVAGGEASPGALGDTSPNGKAEGKTHEPSRERRKERDHREEDLRATLALALVGPLPPILAVIWKVEQLTASQASTSALHTPLSARTLLRGLDLASQTMKEALDVSEISPNNKLLSSSLPVSLTLGWRT
ncbi:hypothetical protein VTN00DRAFT_149 [Thermoascus crustaceus]|uniref:uncharacterized protein n=1 Tax=Thermoascus crustaceus TaxID=5088 RepID=UPI003741F2D1